jgi:hypothetical protein
MNSQSPGRSGPKYNKKSSWEIEIGAHETMRKSLAIQERAIWSGKEEFEIMRFVTFSSPNI